MSDDEVIDMLEGAFKDLTEEQFKSSVLPKVKIALLEAYMRGFKRAADMAIEEFAAMGEES